MAGKERSAKPSAHESLFGPALAETSRLRAELRAMAASRWQLAQLELRAAKADVQHLAVRLSVAALLVVVSLPVLVVTIAELLAGCLGISRAGWLAIGFGSLVLAAAITGLLAWRRFQQHFVGLEETLEVLGEDARWLEELLGHGEKPQDVPR